MMKSMMYLRLAVTVFIVALAIALSVAPSLFPGAQNVRVPVIVGLVLLAALNGLRLSRSWAARSRERQLDEIPKKPLGL
jgi:regulator of sirC expression with transglutaminase-like and TPR domain